MKPTNAAQPAKQARSFWPYAIIVWMALFATGVFSYIVFAQGNRMELVGADYYEQEIRFQKRIDSVDRTRAVQKEIVVGYSKGWIHIALPAEHAKRNPSGSIHLYRPSNSRLDQHFPLSLGASGEQQLDAKALQTGLWKVRVSWLVGKDEFFFDQSIVVGS